jgi:hypothetical protein
MNLSLVPRLRLKMLIPRLCLPDGIPRRKGLLYPDKSTLVRSMVIS